MPVTGGQFRLGEGGWVFAVLSVFLLMTAKDFISPKSRASGVADQLDSDPSIVSNDQIFNTKKVSNMKFFYCISCGYAKAFHEYANFIRENFQDIEVVGDNYSPGAFRVLLANILNFGRMALLFFILLNKNPFNYLGMATPQIWWWLTQHKITGCLMVFFLTNALEAQLMSSGAFEIYYGDERIWSKLETGRVPSHEELFREIAKRHSRLPMDRIIET